MKATTVARVDAGTPTEDERRLAETSLIARLTAELHEWSLFVKTLVTRSRHV